MESSVLFLDYCGLPWLEEFQKHNSHPVHIIQDSRGLASTKPERIILWRNCDRVLRDWWKEHHASVKTDLVWFLEWDVYVNIPLPSVATQGLACKNIHSPNPSWIWFGESHKLPFAARGASPLGVTLFHRKLLDALSSETWDSYFHQNIFCELRIASLAHHLGFPLDRLDLPYVGSKQLKVNHKGIYHPVKHEHAIASPRA